MKRPFVPLALILLLALGLRLAAAGWWQQRGGGQFVFGDSESYWALGRAVAHGGPYHFGPAAVFRTPGYPALLAPIFWLAGPEPSIFWARLDSALLGTLAVAGVWWLARGVSANGSCLDMSAHTSPKRQRGTGVEPPSGLRSGPPSLALRASVPLWAAAAAAVYPEAVAASGLVLSETPFCVFMLAQLALWVMAWQADRPQPAIRWAILSGLAAGAATLVRPSWLLFTPLALAFSVLVAEGDSPIFVASCHKNWDSPRDRRRRRGLAGLTLAGLLLVMIPWWTRNALVTGCFVPTTTQVGASLYDGLNPTADGSSDMRSVEYRARALHDALQIEGIPPDEREVTVDRRLRHEALAWAWHNPGRACWLSLVKIGRMWNFWPNEPAFRGWPVRLAVVFAYAPLALLGIMGLARTIRRPWPYMVCWLPGIYLSLVHMVFVGSLRYRLPALLPLVVLAAWACRVWSVGCRGSRVENQTSSG